MIKQYRRLFSTTLFSLVALFLLSSCATSPPSNVDNICNIFEEKEGWYPAAKASFKKWGTPIHVQMAIMHQESKFVSDAKPKRKKLLGIIPWKRESSAYGYAQVLDGTWIWYQNKTKNYYSNRDDINDALDFIGWYGNISNWKLKISKWNAEHQYLAYHEGHGGYQRKTYDKKPWLKKVAKKVNRKAGLYAKQLKNCEERLNKNESFLWIF